MLPEQDTFFESLFQNNFCKLKIYANGQLHNTFVAEELVQDTFFTAVQKHEEILNHENPEGYLVEVLKYKIKEQRRAQSLYIKRFLSLDHDPLPEAKAPFSSAPISTSSIMNIARETLNQDEWYIFQQFIINGFTHLEIAKKLNITVWASQKRVERIRKKLEDVLPEH